LPRSSGQELAIIQLEEIVERANGHLDISAEPSNSEDGEFVVVDLSLFTRPFRTERGLRLRDRERLRMLIPRSFPFETPSLFFRHKRFIGTPHVQWGHSICLYISKETEWNPSDGLFGFFDRVHDWFLAAGVGELDPDDAPLHPPVAYTASSTQFIINENAPEIPDGSKFWVGQVRLKEVRKDRFDTSNWLLLDDESEANENERFAPALFLAEPFPMEYPRTVLDLEEQLKRHGIEFGTYYALLRYVALSSAEGHAGYVVLGAPMRRRDPNGPLRQHLTVWEIDADALSDLRALSAGEGDVAEVRAAVAKWMVTAEVGWCRVFENRPELTFRRDQDSNAEMLRGKKVAVLGIGALGSSVAEQIARAGAAQLRLIDNGRVKPGLLVRQSFSHSDIGRLKSSARRDSIRALGFEAEVEADSRDLAQDALASLDLGNLDLIIDATASKFVSHRIEAELAEHDLAIPILALSISSRSEFGYVSVRMPDFSGGPIAINRKVKLRALNQNAEHPGLDAFWPSKKTDDLFFPEPGCSDPTFIGSFSDMSAMSGALLNIGLSKLSKLRPNQAAARIVAAPTLQSQGQPLDIVLDNDLGAIEEMHGFRVHISKSAQNSMDAEIARNARLRGEEVETGGLIFGEIDETHQRIFVDQVTPPPRDSQQSPERFLCGVEATAELAASLKAQSRNTTKFVGIWHTHPISPGLPSADDLVAMLQLLRLQAHPPRQVLMVIVGFSKTKPQPKYYAFQRRDIMQIGPEQFAARLPGGSHE